MHLVVIKQINALCNLLPGGSEKVPGEMLGYVPDALHAAVVVCGISPVSRTPRGQVPPSAALRGSEGPGHCEVPTYRCPTNHTTTTVLHTTSHKSSSGVRNRFFFSCYRQIKKKIIRVEEGKNVAMGTGTSTNMASRSTTETSNWARDDPETYFCSGLVRCRVQ